MVEKTSNGVKAGRETTPTAPRVGMRDSRKLGWFNPDAGEILPGVAIVPDMHVVDIGCGNGGHVEFCARRGARVTFVDREEHHVRGLSKRLSRIEGIRFEGIVSQCDPVPMPDGCADLVICTEVLEHVADPDTMMSELVRIAREGALFVLTVPDARGENLIREVVHPDYFQAPNHIRIFTSDDFASLVGRHGLDIVRHEYKGAFWAIFYLLKWVTSMPGEILHEDVHPITKSWTQTWSQVLDHPDGDSIVRALNSALPQSQVIVARKTRK